MISISPWFERSFHFDVEEKYFPLVVERLLGTRLRLRDLVGGLSHDTLVARPGGSWSIQEHVGHLVDLEPLWYGRIDDVLAGVPEMRAADLRNRATDDADHNANKIDRILLSFEQERRRLTDRLKDLQIHEVGMTSRHPRLKQPMRIIDLAVFVAEHDDHHLATIRQRLSNEA